LAPYALIKAANRLDRLGFYTNIFGAALWRKLAMTGRLRRPVASVYGFLPDNWLEPLVMVAPKSHSSGQILHIAGIAPVDLTMTVSAGDQEVLCQELLAGQLRKIRISADVVSGAVITIRCSAFNRDNSKRRLAFHLLDTNIFSEVEL